MTLSPGSRLGPYEITGAIGAGGMGEVFRARDTKLNRDVAIKVLPAAFADDPERLARFTREAQTLASLNHPNIAAIYGIEEVPAVGGSEGAGSRALVMELVEGEDLSAHIARGPIPIAEALPIARQIAEALEAAHEQGIVHRDLKPANIKVRTDGAVKVLDFGLAKAMDQGGGSSSNPNVSHSPTLTHQGTSAGMIIGTAAYMSPEQAKGKSVDKRTDIWAFGVVVYEMLTGQRAFKGEDVSETLASVLKDKLSMDALPAETPARLKRLIERCLDRDLKTRLRDIGEARLKIARIEAGGPDSERSVPASAAAAVVPAWRRALPWALAAAVLAAAALAVPAMRHLRETAPEVHQTRFHVSPPDGWRLSVTSSPSGGSPLPLSVSPDGQRIAFVMEDADGKALLWIRSLDSLTVQPLPGTDGASAPFWSPDSRFLGFFASGKLRKIAVAGGPAVTLCDAPASRGGAWSRDDVIVFNPANQVALQRVSSAGGVPAAATALLSDEAAHRRPFFLPDGRHFIYTASANGKEGIAVYVASLDSTERNLLMNADANNVVYARGHLLFLRETTLMAQPFDAARLALTGEPVPIAEQIRLSGTWPPNAFFSASDDGVLAYESGAAASGRQLTWFDRAGKVLGLVEKPGQYENVTISPDGNRVALDLVAAGSPEPEGASRNVDLWVHDFARGASTRLTFDPQRDSHPTWSPDGSRIAWSASRDGQMSLYQKASSGAGTEEALLKSSDGTIATAYDWSEDGRFLLYAAWKRPPGAPTQTSELWVLPLSGNDRLPALYLKQPGFSPSQARFSPDGRFVAYTSNASGRNEVYVQPFPKEEGGKWMVSKEGGTQPRWRRDGKELFYVALDFKMMSVPVVTTLSFTPGVPKALFTPPIGGGISSNSVRYDVTADGQRFLANVLPQEATAAAAPVTVVLNWDSAVKK